MMKHHVSKGLTEGGKKGLTTVDKELQELLVRKVMVTLDLTRIIKKEKKDALKYLMFLTQNQCGQIKERGCPDG
eukprot:12752404-Ditylum_brightwellii.AAC.1